VDSKVSHGAAFALQWSAGMNYVEKMAPPGYESTFLGIFCSLSNNAGGIIGNIIGGYIYEVYGYQYLWGFGIRHFI
jgi:MFS family permease